MPISINEMSVSTSVSDTAHFSPGLWEAVKAIAPSEHQPAATSGEDALDPSDSSVTHDERPAGSAASLSTHDWGA